MDVKQAARELGVRYVVEGVRRAATTRVNAKLVDTSWAVTSAERYDAPCKTFAVQDEIVNATTAINPTWMTPSNGARH
jgi:TolB-like protein